MLHSFHAQHVIVRHVTDATGARVRVEMAVIVMLAGYGSICDELHELAQRQVADLVELEGRLDRPAHLAAGPVHTRALHEPLDVVVAGDHSVDGVTHDEQLSVAAELVQPRTCQRDVGRHFEPVVNAACVSARVRSLIEGVVYQHTCPA